MFSFTKKAQDIVLPELSEEQLTQVAGGNCSSSSSSSSSDSSKYHHKYHHNHKHHHWHKTNKYNSDWKKSSMPKYGSDGNSHW